LQLNEFSDVVASQNRRQPMFPRKSTVPMRNQPLMTWGLIAINVVVFLL